MCIVKPYNGIVPRIAEDVFLAEGSAVIGDVELGPGCSVWYGSIIRGDVNYIRLGARVLTRQVEGATGQGNQNDLTLHFGLGSQEGPVELEIRWPDGTTQESSTPADRLLVVRQESQ